MNESTLTLTSGETLTGPTILSAIRNHYGRLATFSIEFGCPAIVQPTQGGLHLLARIRTYSVCDAEVMRCWRLTQLSAAEQPTRELLEHIEECQTHFDATGELPDNAWDFFYLT